MTKKDRYTDIKQYNPKNYDIWTSLIEGKGGGEGRGGEESGSKRKAAGLDIGAFHSFFFQML